MEINTINISPLKLFLDYENPRFIIPAKASQDDIIKYLIDNEEIIDLAKGINANNGLLAGERIVVIKDKEKYIVVEGNRRTCACKILLDENLWPKEYSGSIFPVHENTKKNLMSIPVDIVSSREDSFSIMGTKHIFGIKTWSSYAKMKFFAIHYDNGKSIEYISEITATKKDKVISQIKDYKLLNYCFSLDNWTKEERSKILNIESLKTSVFTRAFTTHSEIFNSPCKNLLKLTYDPDTLLPRSELNKDIFNKCIYIIAKYSFDSKYRFNTRSTIDDIPELIDLLKSFYNESDLDPTSEPTEKGFRSKKTVNNDKKENQYASKSDTVTINYNEFHDSENYKTTSNNTESHDNDNSKTTFVSSGKLINKDSRPTTNEFFGNLTWESIDENSFHNEGIISLCQELVEISKSNYYKKIPIASCILMRSLFEQTLIYLLKNSGKYDNIKNGNNGKTPTLERLISTTTKDIDNIFKSNANAKRCYSSFADSNGSKDYFDMVIHNPQLIKADHKLVVAIANSGLKGFIHSILNE